MTTDHNNFEPRGEGDRHHASYRGTGNRRKTMQAVTVEDAPAFGDVWDAMLIELRAIRLGVEMLNSLPTGELLELASDG